MKALLALTPLVKQAFAFAPRKLAICLVLMLLSTITSGGGILLIIPMLSSAGIEIDSIAVNQSVVDKVNSLMASVGTTPSLESVLVLYLFITVFLASLTFVKNVLQSSLQSSFIMNLRNDLAKRLFNARWRYISSVHSSDFSRLLTGQVQIVGSIINQLLSLMSSIILVFVYLGFAALISIELTLVAVLFGAILLLITLPLNSHLRASGWNALNASTGLHRDLFENLENLKIVKSYVAENFVLGKIHTNSKIIEQQTVTVSRLSSLTQLINMIASAILFSLIFYSAITWFKLPLSNFIIVLLIFTRLIPHISSIQSTIQNLTQRAPSYQDLLKQSAQLKLEAEVKPNSIHSTEHTFDFKHSIELRDIGYKHLSGNNFVIENLNVKIKHKQTLAITGPSGVGKSTLVDMISGLVPPTKGKVLVDGTVITDENRQTWRGKVAYVTQEVFLFHDSIRANLTWVCQANGAISEAVNDDQLWRVLKLAAADDFVKQLPQGLETQIGDRGVKLSGGERQRLALARALLSQPDLLILDEATSALDTENEERIRDALINLDGKFTIIIIAHNETTLKHVTKHIRLKPMTS